MMKMKLTHPWRGHLAGDIIDTTPGQRTLLKTLAKAVDYREPRESKPKPPAKTARKQ
jgi:hypothetical protein